MEINPKTIHEELVAALGPNAPSYTTITRWAKRFHEEREDVNDHPRSARVHYPNLQAKIVNWLDKLSKIIHIQLIMKL